MGMRIGYSNISQGRIISHRGPGNGAQGDYLDLRLIGMSELTFVHVRTGGATLSSRDSINEVRRTFYLRLDDWLHSSSTQVKARVHEEIRWARGKDDNTREPPSTGYRLIDHDGHNTYPRIWKA